MAPTALAVKHPCATEDDAQALRIELGAEPLEVVVEAVRRLPAESPAHTISLPPYQRLVVTHT